MTDADLVSIIKAHRRDSLGRESGEISSDRAEAMDRYHGRPYGNEVEGRSQVVSRDLSETVDWLMPAVMRVFTQSGSIAEFDPVGPEDEELAKQESDYTEQVVMKDNPGFMVIHDALKEAALLKNCYAKHWWDEETSVRKEEYSGLSLDQITQMIQKLEGEGAQVEVLEQDSQTIEVPGFPPLEVFDVKLKITRIRKKVRIEAVPVEEVRVSKRCRGSLQDSPFVEHETRKTRSSLVEMGMDKDWVDKLPAFDSNENSIEVNARDSTVDESRQALVSVLDRSMDEIEYCEAYVRVDYDGDGVAELRKVVTCANKIPPGDDWNTEIEACALTGGVIKRVPHRHTGESLHDELADLVEIMTVLKRQLLDNIYLTNNSEVAINERANLKDFQTRTPGGIKRIRGMEPVEGAFAPFQTPSIIGDVLPVIDFFTKGKETRTGIRPGSDMDPDILRESTKGAFLEHMNRASQKIELIARLFAETFVKELYLQVHDLLIRHQDKPRTVQLRGKWVDVNPQEWKERTDLSVRVGLGTGNQEEKKQKLMMATQLQDRLAQQGMVGPKQAFALFEDTMKAMDFDIPEKYVLTPDSPEFAQLQQQRNSKPDPAMAKVQAEAQATQAKMQAEIQANQTKMQMQAQVDQHRQLVEAQQQQARMTMERELAQFKAGLDNEIERFRIQMQQQTQIEIARINAESRLDAAQVTAQTTLSAQQEEASDAAVDDTDD